MERRRKEEETIINKSSKTATGADWLGWLDYYENFSSGYNNRRKPFLYRRQQQQQRKSNLATSHPPMHRNRNCRE
jgi:hypothetical protein